MKYQNLEEEIQMGFQELEQQLKEILGSEVKLEGLSAKEERQCAFLLSQLKIVLMDTAVDKEYLINFLQGIQPHFRESSQGIIKDRIDTAFSIISRLNTMGRQEEVALLLALWRRDPFFRVP